MKTKLFKTQCCVCGKISNRPRENLHFHRKEKNRFCSNKCFGKYYNQSVTIPCSWCKKLVTRKNAEFKKSKTGNVFCNRSCATYYRNSHKTQGTRRSKLEQWLEKQLDILFPSLEIHYNKTNAINAELDIYIPVLRLAFELNGIFHYEPIFGENKLSATQTNDARKFQACIEQNIELCILDVSSMNYFKPTKSQKYFDIIVNIIQTKLRATTGNRIQVSTLPM